MPRKDLRCTQPIPLGPGLHSRRPNDAHLRRTRRAGAAHSASSSDAPRATARIDELRAVLRSVFFARVNDPFYEDEDDYVIPAEELDPDDYSLHTDAVDWRPRYDLPGKAAGVVRVAGATAVSAVAVPLTALLSLARRRTRGPAGAEPDPGATAAPPATAATPAATSGADAAPRSPEDARTARRASAAPPEPLERLAQLRDDATQAAGKQTGEAVASLRAANDRARRAARRALGKVLGETEGQWEDEWESVRGFWPRLQWIWSRPRVQRARIGITLANWSVRVPALAALIIGQISLLTTQVSLPILAPLLLGSGLAAKSIVNNAQVVLPRAGLMAMFLWSLWFLHAAVQSTISLLQRQGAIDMRLAAALSTVTETVALVASILVVLTLLGVNVSGLLLPAGVVLGFACKDIIINCVAGFFLFIVQPFRLGDEVTVPVATPTANAGSLSATFLGGGGSSNGAAPPPSWFRGNVEGVDLRYTTIRKGKRRLFMPNARFLTREFIVMDNEDARRPLNWRVEDSGAAGSPGASPRGSASEEDRAQAEAEALAAARAAEAVRLGWAGLGYVGPPPPHHHPYGHSVGPHAPYPGGYAVAAGPMGPWPGVWPSGPQDAQRAQQTAGGVAGEGGVVEGVVDRGSVQSAWEGLVGGEDGGAAQGGANGASKGESQGAKEGSKQ